MEAALLWTAMQRVLQEAMQQLYNRVYLVLDPSQHASLTTCLHLLAACLEDDTSKGDFEVVLCYSDDVTLSFW